MVEKETSISLRKRCNISAVSRRVSSSSRNSLARIEQLNNLYPANRLLSLFSRIVHRLLDGWAAYEALHSPFTHCCLFWTGIAVSTRFAFHLSFAMLGTILSSTIVFPDCFIRYVFPIRGLRRCELQILELWLALIFNRVSQMSLTSRILRLATDDD